MDTADRSGALSGSGASDPAGQVFSDRLTIVTAAEDVPLVAVRGAMVDAAGTVPIAGAAGCPTADAVWLPRRPAHRRVRSHGRFRPRDGARGSARCLGRHLDWRGCFTTHPPLAKAFREQDDARVVQVRGGDLLPRRGAQSASAFDWAASRCAGAGRRGGTFVPLLRRTCSAFVAASAAGRFELSLRRCRSGGARCAGAGRWGSGGADGSDAHRRSVVRREHRVRRAAWAAGGSSRSSMRTSTECGGFASRCGCRQIPPGRVGRIGTCFSVRGRGRPPRLLRARLHHHVRRVAAKPPGWEG